MLRRYPTGESQTWWKNNGAAAVGAREKLPCSQLARAAWGGCSSKQMEVLAVLAVLAVLVLALVEPGRDQKPGEKNKSGIHQPQHL